MDITLKKQKTCEYMSIQSLYESQKLYIHIQDKSGKVQEKSENVESSSVESTWKIQVENFPAFSVVDNKGNDFFEEWLG